MRRSYLDGVLHVVKYIVISNVLLIWISHAHAAAPAVTLTQNAASVGKYDIYELTMTNPAVYSNPWEDVVINATFTAPSSKTYAVGGFSYDGAHIWKLRFAPMETGNWTWTLSYTDSAGTYNSSGAFTCVASGNSGFLRIHPANPFRFKTEGDGKPFYPLGFNSGLGGALTSGATSAGAYTLANATDFLLVSKNAGFNMWRDNCQSATPIGWNGNFNINGSGKNKFDVAQCMLMDQEAAAVHAAGWKFMLCFWTIPFLSNFDLSNPQTLQATQHLHQFMINRYGAYVDLWELMNEGFPTQAYMNTITAYVRAHDPYVHLITLSYPAADQSALDVVSPHYYLSCTNNTVDSNLKTNTGNYTKFNQPIVYGEAGQGGPNGMYDPDRYRAWIWTCFFTQSASIFWLGQIKHDFTVGNWANGQYIGWEERAESKVLTNCIADFDGAAGPLAVTLNPAAQLRAYALGNATDVGMYVVHATNQNSMLSGATVTLTMPAAMQGFWIDPRTGEILQTVNVSSGQQTISIPPFRVDAALRLHPGALQQPVLQFASSAYSVDNTQNSITLTVSRLGSSAGSVSVAYATSDGLAKAGVNYTAVAGTLSWAAGDSGSKTISVPVIPQTAMAGDLEFLVNLSNPAGGAVLGSASSAHVSLLDPTEEAGYLSAPFYTVTKGAASVLITVNRSGIGRGAISTGYQTRNAGSAMAGTDYVAIPVNTQKVSWAAGDTSPKTFSVQLINNSSTGDKWFQVELGNKAGGAECVSHCTRATVLIIDPNTPATGLLSISGYSGVIGCSFGEAAAEFNVPGTAGSLAIHVSRSNGSSGAATVNYQTNLMGTAEAGKDYTAVTGTLSWASGDSADKIITVPILNNATARGKPWFGVELSSATGATLIMPAIARVNISDPNRAPSAALAAPDSGPAAGGTQVAITGMDFMPGATVKFGANLATGTLAASPSSLVCTTPAGAMGAVTVTVTNSDGQSTSIANGFTYLAGNQPPVINSTPTAMPNPVSLR